MATEGEASDVRQNQRTSIGETSPKPSIVLCKMRDHSAVMTGAPLPPPPPPPRCSSSGSSSSGGTRTGNPRSSASSSSSSSRSRRQPETEEEAIARRFHDAQRMARFRARRRKALEDRKRQERAMIVLGLANNSEGRESEMGSENDHHRQHQHQHQQQRSALCRLPAEGSSSASHRAAADEQHHHQVVVGTAEAECKYSQLLGIIERLGKDVRLTYAGGRSSAERLKSGIGRARGLIRDCLVETRLNLYYAEAAPMMHR